MTTVQEVYTPEVISLLKLAPADAKVLWSGRNRDYWASYLRYYSPGGGYGYAIRGDKRWTKAKPYELPKRLKGWTVIRPENTPEGTLLVVRNSDDFTFAVIPGAKYAFLYEGGYGDSKSWVNHGTHPDGWHPESFVSVGWTELYTIEKEPAVAVIESYAVRANRLERELAEFRQKVVEVGRKYGKENNWCDTVESALKDLGLQDEMKPKTKKVRVIVTHEVEVPVDTDHASVRGAVLFSVSSPKNIFSGNGLDDVRVSFSDIRVEDA